MLLLGAGESIAQLPYSQNQFNVRVEHDHNYAISPNYAGYQDTLMLDIYKPVGDQNCRRPCLVLVHGGAWISGSKSDALMVTFATEFAKKGWVVAAINYRIGMHKAPQYTDQSQCNSPLSIPCAYIADSAEVIRANYRGQQDAKDAIMFMKDRYQQDSTDIYNYFIAGESAGGFIALSAAFFDLDIEKPQVCETIDAAPEPDADLLACLPDTFSLLRQNLGDIQGHPTLYNHDAKVKGVGSLYGGLFSLSVIDNFATWPAMYLYHQGSDILVNYNYGKLLGRIDNECFASGMPCQQYSNYPAAYGGKGLQLYLAGLGTAGPNYSAEIIENYEYMNDCTDNGHSVDMPLERAGNMATLFAQTIAANGNTPGVSCELSVGEKDQEPFRISPNPSDGQIVIESPAGDKIRIFNALGKLVYAGKLNAGANKLDLAGMGKGVFMVQSETNPQAITRIVIN